MSVPSNGSARSLSLSTMTCAWAPQGGSNGGGALKRLVGSEIEGRRVDHMESPTLLTKERKWLVPTSRGNFTSLGGSKRPPTFFEEKKRCGFLFGHQSSPFSFVRQSLCFVCIHAIRCLFICHSNNLSVYLHAKLSNRRLRVLQCKSIIAIAD